MSVAEYNIGMLIVFSFCVLFLVWGRWEPVDWCIVELSVLVIAHVVQSIKAKPRRLQVSLMLLVISSMFNLSGRVANVSASSIGRRDIKIRKSVYTKMIGI